MSKKQQPKAAIIVESPTKTRTLARFLGKGYKLLATRGHVRDLPERGLAVDVEHGFEPQYEVIPGQEKQVAALRKGLKGIEEVYLACDPDREGEAICWHVSEVLGLPEEQRRRIEFNEITRRAVVEALGHPRSIDERRVKAQQARRVLDRIVGYRLSPLLQQRLGGWKSGRNALSAGRVQSAALRLVVEREKERAAFKPQEFWRVGAHLQVATGGSLQAEVVKRDDKKLKLATGLETAEALRELRQAEYVVSGVTRKPRLEKPAPPFTTSTLQRAASSRLGLSARRTMRLAQELYEGVELDEGVTGLITYMRTDSTRIALEARAAAVSFIQSFFGEEYVGPGTRGRKARGAQEAHEAIRPTRVELTPESVAGNLTPQQFRLYRLIWQRFVASQMAPAEWEDTTVEIQAGRYGLEAKGKVLKFPGWRAVYGAEAELAEDEDNGRGTQEENGEVTGGNGVPEGYLPEVEEGTALALKFLHARQLFTKPPARYTEGSLVAALERHGIGRPSTYAPIIETLRQRRYVTMEGRSFVPTPLGIAVYQWLMEYFPQIMDLEFTARMEERLDAIETGEADWVQVLAEFYDQFVHWLSQAKDAKPQVIEGAHCPKCGGKLIERISRFGRFASCENYPDCDYTHDVGWKLREKCPRCGTELEVAISRSGGLVVRCPNPKCDYVRSDEEEEQGGEQGEETDEKKLCPECGKPMVVRRGYRGRKFWGCSGYPECTHTEPLASDASGKNKRRKAIETDLECPECGKKLVVRFGRRGPFLGCSGYPKCRFTRNLTDEEREKYLETEASEEVQEEEKDTSSTSSQEAPPAEEGTPEDSPAADEGAAREKEEGPELSGGQEAE